ncbi:hypothetical protein AWZ03_003971 [Drosophila navojoa]|uniref:Uncharacterized protein n=1 Tax=Drosophila navojoa TaxID=7232 RepID=A0A484BLT3_DRONA|nr:hypothetical protein AWZ03_003971 [Drosophila navojoa]
MSFNQAAEVKPKSASFRRGGRSSFRPALAILQDLALELKQQLTEPGAAAEAATAVVTASVQWKLFRLRL